MDKIPTQQLKLNRDEIIIKFWNSKQLHDKFDALLVRCGLSRATNILEDCTQQTFMELSRIPAEKLERLYQERPGQFEGYIIMIFKNVSIRQSNDNPKGCLVSHLHHASSLNQNASISPTEVGDIGWDVISDDYNFIPVEREDDILSINNTFNYITSQLSKDEITILNLLLDKKKSKGRYTSDIKIRVEELKEKLKLLTSEYSNIYNYKSTKERKFKTEDEIKEAYSDNNRRTKRNQHDR